MTRTFTKPPLTCAQQVQLLQNRGMVIDDPEHAGFYLTHLNYYRLGAYWLPFEKDHASHAFREGTTFDAVLNLYIFDRELRLLVLDAVERVEVSMRGQWAHQMAHLHGAHAHLEPTLALNGDRFHRNLAEIKNQVERSDEEFIKHMRRTYSEALPAIWAVCEVMSLGLLSKCYNNLGPKPVRRAIANSYGLDDRLLESWLHHLTLIRNICAHHSRLWNREFTITPMIPRTKPSMLGTQFVPHSRKLYNTLVILLYLLDLISPNSTWRQRVKALIATHRIETSAMNFPADWGTRPIWR